MRGSRGRSGASAPSSHHSCHENAPTTLLLVTFKSISLFGLIMNRSILRFYFGWIPSFEYFQLIIIH